MTHLLFVTDTATRIPVSVTHPFATLNADDRDVYRAAGYDPDDPSMFIVTDLTTLQTEHDPSAWTNATMRAFHWKLMSDGIDGERTVDVREKREAMS